MKKRILSVILTLVMILSLFPVIQLPASAAMTTVNGTRIHSGSIKFTDLEKGDLIQAGAQLTFNVSDFSGNSVMVLQPCSCGGSNSVRIATISRGRTEAINNVNTTCTNGVVHNLSKPFYRVDDLDKGLLASFGMLLLTNCDGPSLTVNYNANGGSGSMASQKMTYGTATKLTKNTFTYSPTITFKSNVGTLDLAPVSVPASFGGWMDKSTTTFNGTTYPYYEFDAAGYANRNGDVLVSSAFGNGVYDKEAMLRHYIAYGKNEYENGSANRAAATGYFGTYPDGATVKNLAGEAGSAVSLYAKWNYGTTTLPTPITDGYTFRCWTADLMDIATLTDNLEINDTTRGTIGYNDGYALTENLIPVVGGTTFTSNMEVCGVYAYDKDGNFLNRCSSYATTHTIPYAAAFVRVEVCTKKELSFDDFKNLSLEYSVSAGTVVPVAGNQTYTANWQGNYNIRFDANGGEGGTQSYVVMGSSRYSDVSWLTVSRKGYEFAGWTTEPDGTELVYGADGYCVPGSVYWDESGNWKYDGDVVVYAKWTPLPVTITAQTTAGGSVTGTKTVNAGENVELLATPDAGYEFIGWYDGETLVCETENFSVENVVEDKTYTARFKEYVCNHSHDGVEFKSWKNSKSLPSAAGNYCLATDVTLSEGWTAPAGEVTLCLNGKVINLNSKHISVENGATLNIYDCGDTVRYYDVDSTTGKWTLKSEGTSDYTTEGGVITGGSNIFGGAIAVNDSTLNLYGGNLAGNTASSNNGGAVYITKGTLTIDGANILGNYAFSNGGGVFAHDTTVTLNGGNISYNRACITDNKGGDGGGIYLSGCTTTMNAGIVSHNTNLYDGAGIMNSAGGTLTVNGGTISDNTTAFWGEWSDYCGGAGICNDSESTLILNDGTISNNTGVSNGGGVFNRGTFNMNGGTIEGNICVSLDDKVAKGLGDGVTNETGAVFNMTGGYIGAVHNDLIKDDTVRGVYNKGTFTMTGGEIFASSDDAASCYGISNYATYNSDGTEVSGAVANIGGNAVITGQCGYKPFAINGTGTVNISGNAIVTAKNVGDCKDNRSRAVYLSNGTLNISGSPEIVSLSDANSSNTPDTNGIRFEPKVQVNISGSPKITAETAHIQLEGTPLEPATHINIVGKLEKPETPYVVVKRSDATLVGGVITEGWSTYMSGADPDDYFTGAGSFGAVLQEDELYLTELGSFTITAMATEGGVASGSKTVKENSNVTLTAKADEGYEFIGWFDGDTKVCDTAEFVVENVSSDKTYTAKFEIIEAIEPEVIFDFDSIRTGNGKNIVVDHENKVISAEVETGDNLVLYVHQKDIITGGQIRLNSYNGNKVTYDSAGSYNIYSISSEFITVSLKITIGDKTEVYDLTVRFAEKAVPFNSIRTENGKNIKIDHDNKIISVDVEDGSDNLVLYVHQKDIIPDGQIRMKSYNGNKVTYDANGIYKIYTIDDDSIDVVANIIVGGETMVYTIRVNYTIDAPGFDFTKIKCDNAESISVDNENKIITVVADSDTDNVVIYKKQYEDIKGTLVLTSFMGNRVQSNQADGTYKVCFVKNTSVDVKAKITINGVSEEYIIRTVFDREWGFENLKADNVTGTLVDHDSKTVVLDASEGSDAVVLYIDQICDAGEAQVWMKSYNGNKVIYNSSDRTYTIKKGASDSLTVSVKITILGETRIYDLTVGF